MQFCQESGDGCTKKVLGQFGVMGSVLCVSFNSDLTLLVD